MQLEIKGPDFGTGASCAQISPRHSGEEFAFHFSSFLDIECSILLYQPLIVDIQSSKYLVMVVPSTTSLGLGITFPVVAILAVCDRYWARHQKKLWLWWDDYSILPGLLRCRAVWLAII